MNNSDIFKNFVTVQNQNKQAEFKKSSNLIKLSIGNKQNSVFLRRDDKKSKIVEKEESVCIEKKPKCAQKRNLTKLGRGRGRGRRK